MKSLEKLEEIANSLENDVLTSKEGAMLLREYIEKHKPKGGLYEWEEETYFTYAFEHLFRSPNSLI
jgi:hypothetical protein